MIDAGSGALVMGRAVHELAAGLKRAPLRRYWPSFSPPQMIISLPVQRAVAFRRAHGSEFAGIADISVQVLFVGS